MPGQVRRQHGKTVMGEPAAVQRPGRMVEAGAVNHHDGGQGRIAQFAVFADIDNDGDLDVYTATSPNAAPKKPAKKAAPKKPARKGKP